MKTHRIVFILVLLSQALIAISQNNLDVFNFSGRYGFPQSYEHSYNEKASEKSTFLNLTVPIPISEKTVWYNSLNHFYFNVDGDPAIPTGEINPINLHGFILRTGLYQKFDDGKGIQLLFAPRLMSDLKNVDANSIQLGGVFMYEKVFRKDLSMSFGAMYNQELFGPYVVPVVKLHWQLSDKWIINGLFPITLNISDIASENLTIGFSHYGLMTSYYLGSQHYDGDYVERQSIDPALFIRLRLLGNFYLEGKIGRTFGRGYTQYAGDQKVDFSLPLIEFGDDRVAKNTTFEDGLFIDFGIACSINLSER